MTIEQRGRGTWLWAFAMAVVFVNIPASAEVVGVKIAKDETVSVGGKGVRHVAGSFLERPSGTSRASPRWTRSSG